MRPLLVYLILREALCASIDLNLPIQADADISFWAENLFYEENAQFFSELADSESVSPDSVAEVEYSQKRPKRRRSLPARFREEEEEVIPSLPNVFEEELIALVDNLNGSQVMQKKESGRTQELERRTRLFQFDPLPRGSLNPVDREMIAVMFNNAWSITDAGIVQVLSREFRSGEDVSVQRVRKMRKRFESVWRVPAWFHHSIVEAGREIGFDKSKAQRFHEFVSAITPAGFELPVGDPSTVHGIEVWKSLCVIPTEVRGETNACHYHGKGMWQLSEPYKRALLLSFIK